MSLSAGLAWDIHKNLSAKLNFASGFTAPNYAQTGSFGKHEGTYRFERGNTSLSMEKNYETDVELSYHGTSISLVLSAYYNKVNDYIYISNTGDSIQRIRPVGTDTLPVYAYMQNNATLQGGEFMLLLHPKNLKWID